MQGQGALPQRFSAAAMVARVSPSWTKMPATSAILSTVSLHAMLFASIVIMPVSSKEFISYTSRFLSVYATLTLLDIRSACPRRGGRLRGEFALHPRIFAIPTAL